MRARQLTDRLSEKLGAEKVKIHRTERRRWVSLGTLNSAVSDRSRVLAKEAKRDDEWGRMSSDLDLCVSPHCIQLKMLHELLDWGGGVRVGR